MLFIKIIIITVLILISFQDIKSRLVYWFFFPIVGISMSALFFQSVPAIVFIINIAVNSALIIMVISILYVYASIKLKVNFWKEAFGLGDALFFLAFAISFPVVSFLILFVGSLFFSLIIGIGNLLYKKTKMTIPLAGYMAMYLVIVFIGSWACNFNLYTV